ncbi:hypothetical protein [Mycobacterium arosiense]|uniref:hypothetical protein n=1 Tax=Mycobacterium arosiense TaxID=425468 RepID=UPI0011548B1B|nr:hypothetical protein [Mycobacterium arosiense]
MIVIVHETPLPTVCRASVEVERSSSLNKSMRSLPGGAGHSSNEATKQAKYFGAARNCRLTDPGHMLAS